MRFDPESGAHAARQQQQAQYGGYAGAAGGYGGAPSAYGGPTGAYGGATGAYGGQTGAYGGQTGAYGGQTGAYGGATGYGGGAGAYGGATGASMYAGATGAHTNGGGAANGGAGGSQQAAPAALSLKDCSGGELLERLPRMQRLMLRMLACVPEGAAAYNPLCLVGGGGGGREGRGRGQAGLGQLLNRLDGGLVQLGSCCWQMLQFVCDRSSSPLPPMLLVPPDRRQLGPA